jgi:hypothetical protein
VRKPAGKGLATRAKAFDPSAPARGRQARTDLSRVKSGKKK